MKKTATSFFAMFVFALIIMSAPAFAQDIGTSDELMEILTATSGTTGNTYNLTADITISTASLDTNRVFRGTLNGNGHTITVSDNVAQPLFGVLGNGAQVNSLDLEFSGDAQGATLANLFGGVTIDGVNVSVAGDVTFKTNDTLSYASGLLGLRHPTIFSVGDYVDPNYQQAHINDTIISVTGIIGSKTGVNNARVYAVGVTTDDVGNDDGYTRSSDIILDNVSINADGIYAVSAYTASGGNPSCSAAGVATGGVHASRINVKDVSVKVNNDISATAPSGTNSQVDAYGLAYIVRALYSCSVDVGGNIEAIGHGFDSTDETTSNEDAYIGTTDSAMGFAWTVSTVNNQEHFGNDGVGDCSVNVGGDIVAITESSKAYPWWDSASGVMHWCKVSDGEWKDTSITVNDIKAELTNTSAAERTIRTYSCGFAANTYGNSLLSADGVSVTAHNISSANHSGKWCYASGFMNELDANYVRNCTINVNNITADTDDRYYGTAAGFMSYVLYSGNVTNVSVTANTISGDIPDVVGGFVYSANGTDTIQNCTVTVQSIEAPNGTATLFLGWNDGDGSQDRYSLYNNKVIIPSSAVEYPQGPNDGTYVYFTGGEAAGRAAKRDTWEDGNQLVLSDTNKTYDVKCLYDNGDSTYGTLWGIEEVVKNITFRTIVDSGFCSDSYKPQADADSTGAIAVSAMVENFENVMDDIAEFGFTVTGDNEESRNIILGSENYSALMESKYGAFYTIFYGIPYADFGKEITISPYVVDSKGATISGAPFSVVVENRTKWLGSVETMKANHSSPRINKGE